MQQRSFAVLPLHSGPKFTTASWFFSLFKCCFSYCELLEAKGIMCAHSFTTLLLPYLHKEMQASPRVEVCYDIEV
jgi:hypothetical protein